VRAVLFFAGTVLVAGAFSLTVLRPMGDEQLLPAPVAGQRFWELSTGSRLAYVRVPTEGEARPEPVIFLHGGPGIPDMRGDVRYFGDLSREGFDVYIYDLVGRGSSSRLDDPRHYTLGRDVRDLEEVRRKIGAERMILVGHSHGGMVAAAYAASHPDHVAKLVLSSPKTPRPLLGYTILQVNPEAAHSFAGDAEMDARFDRVYNRSRSALHCEGERSGPRLHGLGFYAHYYPNPPPESPTPTSFPTSPVWARRLSLSRVLVTTSPGPPLRST
jgi:proline iminopeptidase